MSEPFFCPDPSGFSISGQKKGSSEASPPRNWKGRKIHSVNRMRMARIEGFQPLLLRSGQSLRFETLYRKGKGFLVRWRPGRMAAHSESRDDAVLTLLAVIRDRLIDLECREDVLTVDERTVLQHPRRFFIAGYENIMRSAA